MLTRYIIWGAFQQISIIAMVYFIPVEDIVKTILAIILFTAVHFPNKPLMIVTFFLGVSIYIPFFMYDMNILIYYALMHAFGGTLYKMLGWEMRVLWNYPKDS